MLQQLAEQLKNLSADELAELNNNMQNTSFFIGICPKGTVSDGAGHCITDPLQPDPTHP